MLPEGHLIISCDSAAYEKKKMVYGCDKPPNLIYIAENCFMDWGLFFSYSGDCMAKNRMRSSC